MIIKEVDVFKAKLTAARSGPDLSCADACKLGKIKSAWSRTGVGLNKDEERWLTKLAIKGGWTTNPADSEFTYVEEDEPCKA